MTVDWVSISLRRTAVRRAESSVGRIDTTCEAGEGGRGAICSQNKER